MNHLALISFFVDPLDLLDMTSPFAARRPSRQPPEEPPHRYRAIRSWAVGRKAE